MLTLVTGGSGSGKSEFAEDLSVSYNSKNLIYIATMFPYDDESLKKVERHKKMREHKNFKTVECFKNLSDAVITEDSTVLLDCMSNLVANEMYLEGGAGEMTVHSIIKGVREIRDKCENLVIVTNEVFSDAVYPGKEQYFNICCVPTVYTCILFFVAFPEDDQILAGEVDALNVKVNSMLFSEFSIPSVIFFVTCVSPSPTLIVADSDKCVIVELSNTRVTSLI